MAGNSQRRGAVRKPGTKKGPTKGSGGKGRRALSGKGPTPKAVDRPYHPAAKRQAKRQSPGDRQFPTGRGSTSGRSSSSTSRRTAGPNSTSGRPSAGGRRGSGTRTSTTRAFTPSARRPGAARTQRPSSHRPPARRPGSDGGPEVIGGRGPVLEALMAGVPALNLEVAGGMDSDSRLRDILRLAAAAHLPIQEAHRIELERRGPAKNQGVVLHIAPFAYTTLDALLTAADDAARPPFIVALDSVTDPHNLGAVIRSAGAFGADGVIIPTRRAAGVNAGAWKASAGAAAWVPVARVNGLVRALKQCQDAGLMVVGLDGGGAMDVSQALAEPDAVAVVVGSEGKGLSRLVRETCDITARIPIHQRTESLNASVAAGIACYEVAKARTQPGA